jgi:hypothetical protein
VPAPPDLKTLCAALPELDLTSSLTHRDFLLADKMQLTEGLVVEYFVDRITGRAGPRIALPAPAHRETPKATPALRSLEVDTVVAYPGRDDARWFAFVLTELPETDAVLIDYLLRLEKQFDVHLVRWHLPLHQFSACAVRNGRCAEPFGELTQHLRKLSGRRHPLVFKPAEEDRGSERHQSASDFLIRAYGSRILERVVVPRIFVNCGVQRWFHYVWNVDRILLIGAIPCALEIKHKFPMEGKNPRFSFGINNGQLSVLTLLAGCDLRCVHLVLANPYWSRGTGARYLFKDHAARRITGIEVKDLPPEALADIGGREVYGAPDYTAIDGLSSLRYRRVGIEEFSDIGVLFDEADVLRSRLAGFLSGEALPTLNRKLLLGRRRE